MCGSGWYNQQTQFCVDNKICNENNYNPVTQHCNIFTINDARDGKNYNTIVIGNQYWMAENVNYYLSDSKCNNDKGANCDKYGRLYAWKTATYACPSGWHLPSIAEWDTLINFVGSNAGTKLKASSDWNYGAGTDDYGFSALPGGSCSYDGSFQNVGDFGGWWSSSNTGNGAAYLMTINGEYATSTNSGQGNLYSVRCLQD